LEWQEQLFWVRVLCRCERVLGVGLTAAELFYRDVLDQNHLSVAAGAKIPGGVRAEAIAAGLALLAAHVDSVEPSTMEQQEVFFRDHVAHDMPGIFIDEPWKESEEVASLSTLVRLFDAAILAQQILARNSHSG
jgi:hypothetical protein